MSEEQKLPSKEEIVAFLQEQIYVKKVQFELQELNTKLAVARAEELKALQFVAQMTNPQPHVLTQEDLDANPEIAEQGFKVGDEVVISNDDGMPKSRNLKKD
jgi:hypothetical protein